MVLWLAPCMALPWPHGLHLLVCVFLHSSAYGLATCRPCFRPQLAFHHLHFLHFFHHWTGVSDTCNYVDRPTSPWMISNFRISGSSSLALSAVLVGTLHHLLLNSACPSTFFLHYLPSRFGTCAIFGRLDFRLGCHGPFGSVARTVSLPRAFLPIFFSHLHRLHPLFGLTLTKGYGSAMGDRRSDGIYLS